MNEDQILVCEEIEATQRILKRAGIGPEQKIHASVVAVMLGKTSAEIKRLAEHVTSMTSRLAVVEGMGLSFEGTHQRGKEYRRGHAVVSDGSLWIATGPTTDTPGVSGAWALAAKSGRDAR